MTKPCKEVTKMTLRTKILIDDMLDTMYEAMGDEDLQRAGQGGCLKNGST